MTYARSCPTTGLLLAGITLLAVAIPATAEMTLDSSRSSVSLISTKIVADGSASVTERHQFNEVKGSVSEDGIALIQIALDSIDTGIDIRNERMAEFLFKTGTYPEATIKATVPAELMNSGSHLADLDASLTLHGQNQMLSIPVAIYVDDQAVVVTATEPVLLEAGDFDLDGGIAKLAELAALLHIPTTVPVSFELTFTAGDS